MQWFRKFAVAIAGIAESTRHHGSFRVHLVASILVVGVAVALGVEPWRWAVLLLAITLVWTAELLNTALEELVRVLHPQTDKRVGRALDAAAGAVLVAAIGAATVGILTLGPPLWTWIKVAG
ncbi:MAG: diacylglycerol kinase [Rubripirellula sp.]